LKRQYSSKLSRCCGAVHLAKLKTKLKKFGFG